MNKREFIKKVTDELYTSGAKKTVSIPKTVFHISDNDGNVRDFTVRGRSKNVRYTVDDVSIIIDICLDVITNALENGDSVVFSGVGGIDNHYRKPRRSKDIHTKEEIIIPGRYIPRIVIGKRFRQCGLVYTQKVKERTEAMEAEAFLDQNLPNDSVMDGED